MNLPSKTLNLTMVFSLIGAPISGVSQAKSKQENDSIDVNKPHKLMANSDFNENDYNEILNTIVNDAKTKKQQVEIDKRADELREKRKKEIELKTQRDQFYKKIKEKDPTNINLNTPSGLTVKKINYLLENTKLKNLGEAFYNAEEKYGVNSYYLIAHAIWESDWGNSNIAQNKKNLYGFTAYDGSAYSSAREFASYEESIMVVAEFVNRQYLQEKGKYYNGANLKGMNIKYASDENWSFGIGELMEYLAVKVKNKDDKLTVS